MSFRSVKIDANQKKLEECSLPNLSYDIKSGWLISAQLVKKHMYMLFNKCRHYVEGI